MSYIDLDLLIDDFFEYIDLDSIRCVNDLIESLREYLNTDLHILTYYNIDDLSVLDTNFNASYDDDEAIDKKIKTIDKCIRLMIPDKYIS